VTTEYRTCAFHPDRSAGVICQRCDKPICPACMTQASVGFHCPDCARKGAQKVLKGPAAWTIRPVVTQAIIALNVVMFVLSSLGGGSFTSGSGSVVRDYGLFGPFIAENQEWYRIITSGFLHAGLFHIGFNMYALWIMGNQLERSFGRLRFGLIYAVGLVAGSFGALLVSPNALTIGASGAVFGLFAAAFVAQRAMGMNPWSSGIGGIIIINLVITIAVPGISLGGHVGGLAGGAIAAWAMIEGPRRLPSLRSDAAAVAMGVGLFAAFFVAALWAAAQWASPVFG
jgi:membrane associated rhomboid family serine protease